jgi:hypothetical protein
MSLFGDDDPEDAWDETDPPGVKVAILARMLVHVAEERVDPGHDHQRILVRLHFALAATGRLQALGIPQYEAVLIALLVGFLLLENEATP